jgi:hypothetical protein
MHTKTLQGCHKINPMNTLLQKDHKILRLSLKHGLQMYCLKDVFAGAHHVRAVKCVQ